MENNEKQKTNKTKMDGKKKRKRKRNSQRNNTTRGGSTAYYRFNVYPIDIIILKNK